jgi:hypothetical protein
MSSATKHISQLKQVTELLSKMDSYFSHPHTKEKWFLGYAIQHVVSLMSSLTSRYDSLELQIHSGSRTCNSEDNFVAESDYVPKIDCKLNTVKESIMRIIQVLYKKLQNEVDVDSKGVKTEGSLYQIRIIFASFISLIIAAFMNGLCCVVVDAWHILMDCQLKFVYLCSTDSGLLVDGEMKLCLWLCVLWDDYD